LGSDRKDWDNEGWRARVSQSFGSVGATGPAVAAVIESTRYLRADVTDPADLRNLLAAGSGPLIIFFALPPAVTEEACQVLATLGVAEDTRLVLEKPFGTDATSAERLNRLLTGMVPEEQIYRVDHYLGMSTVLNILGLRFTNRMLESLLSAEHVASVDIAFEESLALEGRAGYYDGAGALIDMLQSHGLHVLSFVAMEPPSTLDAEDLRHAAATVLRATRVWDDDPTASTRRARYTAGQVSGRAVPSYTDEKGVDPSLGTETYAEMVVEVNTWRWAGVPFRLWTGKALRARDKRVVVTFKQPAWVPRGLLGFERPDRVRIGLDPGDVRLDFNVTGPGNPRVVDRVGMTARLDPGDLPPYGQVLAGVLDFDPTLSVRGDQAVQTWRIVEPVLGAWRAGAVPLEEYPAGSDGPADAAPATA
jgi:glucose-6-phosphate 1-dehydrogenase